MFEIFLILLVITVTFLLFGWVYLMNRSFKVVNFITRINGLCYDWAQKRLVDIALNNEKSPYDWFYRAKVPSYWKLLFSFRPLTMDEWFDKKDLQKLFEE